MSEMLAPVQTPRREPPRMGLITSAPTNLGGQPALPDTDEVTGARLRWEGGLTFRPDTCPEPALNAQCQETFTGAEPPAAPDLVTYQPWSIQVAYVCGTQEQHEDVIARGRQALERMVPMAIEAEFEQGTRAQAETLDNDYLANAATAEDLTPSGGVAGLVQAHGSLVDYLAQTCDGGRGMIHAPRRVLSAWDSAGLVRREPGTLIIYDLFENIVVPAVGYLGMGPGGDVDTTGETGWAYATGMVNVRLSSISTTPATADNLGDIGTPMTEDNEVLVLASQYVAAYWDGIEHGAINVGLCSPCCTPETGS